MKRVITIRLLKSILYLVVSILVGCTDRVISVEEAFKAVDSNDSSTLKKFLEQGGNPNSLNSANDSLLYVATGPHGGYQVLKLLLESGADPDKGSGKYTPLMNASSWCWLDGVKLLVENGANLELKNSRDQTALETVCFAGGEREEVISFLKSLTQN
jgi:ankyrin repeat protein